MRTNSLGFSDLLIPVPYNVFHIISEYSNSGLCEVAELNTFGTMHSITPDDPYFASQWHLSKINAPAAWDIATGDPNIVIGILDTGTDWDHEDLGMGSDGYQNIWLNPGEDPWADPNDPNSGTDGIDTDGNGFVDDWKGWDFVNNNNDSRDIASPHGTWVAGIASAKTNNTTGVSGVAGGFGGPGTKLMILKVANQLETISAVVDDAILYAAENGADIINMSFGALQSAALDAALKAAYETYGVLIVASAGNCTCSGISCGTNGSTTVGYPANNPFVVGIGATASSDIKACFSKFGPNLEIAAPGDNIFSTQPNNTYGDNHDGTSFASPQVAGLAALMLSVNPSLSNDELRTILRNTAEKVGGYDYNWDLTRPGHSKQLGYGRINAFTAVQAAQSITCSTSVFDVIINFDRTWTTNRTIKGMLIVKKGTMLTIKNATITFGPFSGIIIEASAKVILDNATLTDLTTCGPLMWQGVQILGDPIATVQFSPLDPQNPQGVLLMRNGSVIENAHIGALANEGGVIWSLSGSKFINNRVNVQIDNSPNANCRIEETEFINDSPMADVATYSGEGMDAFVVAINSGNITLRGNTYINTNSFSPTQKGTGIRSYNSHIRIVPKYKSKGNIPQLGSSNLPIYKKNVFQDLYKGIDHYSLGGLAHIVVDNAEFNDIVLGITSNGSNFDKITNNSFTVQTIFIKWWEGYGIYMYNCSGYEVSENTISSNSSSSTAYGIAGRNTTAVGPTGLIYNNTIDGINIATQLEGDNSLTSVLCNTYTDYTYAIRVTNAGSTSGVLGNQGDCTNPNIPPAGNEFEICTGTNQSQIYDYAGNGFTYNAHPTEPVDQNCVSATVNVNNCDPGTSKNKCLSKNIPGLTIPQLKRKIDRTPEPKEKQRLKDKLVRKHLEKGESAKAEHFLANEHIPDVNKIRVAYFLDRKEFAKCQQVLDSIPQNNNENIRFHQLYQMQVNLCVSGRQINEMTPTEKQVVMDVANSSTKVSVNAESILAMVDKSTYTRIPETIPNSNNARLANNNDAENTITKPILDCFPNPFNRSFIVEYHLPNHSENGQVVIYDIITGRTVKTIPVKKKLHSVVFDNTGFKPGMYVVQLKDSGGAILKSIKLIYIN